jgi:purine nucleosidase
VVLILVLVQCAVFYWIDPWGVQWEMEQGRPVDRAVKGIMG